MIDLGTPKIVRNMKVSHIVWLIAFVGLALAAFFAQSKIREEAAKSTEMHIIGDLVDFSASISDYVHEQQKERGASAIFLSSQGQLYRDELSAQRLNTDEKLAQVTAQVPALLKKPIDPRLKQNLSDLVVATQEIGDVRAQIDALTIPRPQAIGFYTMLDRAAIDLVGEVSRGVTDPAIGKKLLVYSAFLTGKDSAGIERALGASGFAGRKLQLGLEAKVERPDLRTRNYV